MRYNSDGRPDSGGLFEMINGRLTLCDGPLEEGQYLGFDRVVMDVSPVARHFFRDEDVKAPQSIDETLTREFEVQAKAKNMSVREMLTSMTQGEIAAIVAQVATEFVAQAAAAGVASTFSKDSVFNDSELRHRIAKAQRDHDMQQAHKPAGQRQPFVADAALADAIRTLVSERAQAVRGAQFSDAALRSEAEGARIARKHLTSNAWRQ